MRHVLVAPLICAIFGDVSLRMAMPHVIEAQHSNTNRRMHRSKTIAAARAKTAPCDQVVSDTDGHDQATGCSCGVAVTAT